ncbi:YesL family protein [Amphibacillus sediminis]|uniref:YesL family protein n=1 Tax=Amphibacillus sediminis TaxID=360185 RepID=UPI000835ECB2|nr:DUF624 domain-containing protein [Amphibacillus sediminis]
MFLDNQPILQKLYMLTIWISRLATVNLLWLIFTLLGLGLFGIGPATLAMSVVISRWIDRDDSFSVLKVFINVYRKYFFKSNLICLLLVLVSGMLVYNYLFIEINSFPMFYRVITVAMGILHVLISLIIIPLYTNNEVGIIELFKTSALFVIGYPINSLVIAVATAGLIVIQLFMPGLLFFFSGSSMIFVVILRIKRALEKTKELQQGKSVIEV